MLTVQRGQAARRLAGSPVAHAALRTSLLRPGTEYFAPALLASRRRNGALDSSDLALVSLRTTSNAVRTFHSSPSASAEPSSSRKASTSTSASSEDTAVTKPRDTLMQRAWIKIKHEASHYWHGTKLLGKEIRLSGKYQMKLLRGKKLTRREKRQLKRTTTDLLRLIPFSVFIIVPFMELLLPVALRLFPNMLPSTFRDESKELEKKRKLLKVRLEMAKFLQDTLKESGVRSAERIRESDAFKEFFRKVRSTGETPSTDDIVNVAKLFEDDLTLDNLSRPQLVSMCRYMNINAFGTDNFLRHTIRNRMASLERDDRMIDNEGIDSLTVSELRHACQSRGIRSMKVDEESLRKELGQWIELHLHRGLSPTLLILGRAFAFTRGGEQEAGDTTLESLKDALSSLPDTLLNETALEVSSDNITSKQRLAVLEEQEELIADESEQEEKEEEARKQAKEAERLKAEKEERERAEAEAEQADEMLPDAASTEAVAKEGKEGKEEKVDPKDVRMTSEQLGELGEALSILSAKSSVLQERQDLQKLMEENAEAAKDTEGSSSSLVKRVQKMISQIDEQISSYDNEVGERMHLFDVGHDGKICVADLEKALKAINHAPSDDAVAVLVDKLDVDHDGFIPLDHVVSLAQEEGLGIVIDDTGEDLLAQGKELRTTSFQPEPSPKPKEEEGKKEEAKPKKSDIVED